MKKFILCIFFPFLVHADLTLQDCIATALKNNELTSIAELQIMIAGDRLDEVWGLALPKLTGQVDYIASGEPRRFLSNRKTLNAKASLLIPIYNFGGADNLIKSQGKLYEASFYSSEQIRQELIHAVTHAYFRLLEAYRLHTVVEESILTLKEQARISQDSLEQGLVHANDVSLIAIQLSQREQDLVQEERNRLIASARLNRLMGQPINTCVVITDVLGDIDWEQNMTVMIEKALEKNPSLTALRLQVEAAYYAYRSEKGALYPALYAFSDVSTTNDYALPYTEGVNAGLSIQMTFYDGTVLARIHRKEKEWLEAQKRLQALEYDIDLNVRSAYLALESAKNCIPIALRGTVLAEQNLKDTQSQYQEGLINLYDLLADEERLAQSRSNYLQSLYNFHRAKADLELASGVKLCTY